MEKTEKKKKSNRLLRVVSGLVLFPGFAAIMIFSNNLIFDIFVGIIGIMCLYEFYTCFSKGEKAKPNKILGYLMILSFNYLIFKKHIIKVYIFLKLKMKILFFHVLMI